MGSYVRISALLRAEILVQYALFVMQYYLTRVWGLSFTHAAAIVNIWTGLSKVFPVFLLYLVDALLGNFKMLVITSIAYSVGTGFVTMSTPRVFASSTGTCKQYEPECIGGTQKFLFHTGMALIAVGIAGNFTCVEPFIKEQEGQRDLSIKRNCLRKPSHIVIVIVALIGAFGLPFMKSWSLRFGIPALCTAIATLLFLSGTLTYKKNGPQPHGSPLRDICRVFVAAASKSCQTLPADQRIYRKDETEPKSFDSNGSLRCLEKAAIILPDISEEEQKKNEWRLCSVAEVEAAKIVVRLVPMWTTFIICGIVSSIGNTYFIEQANHMNRKIGPLKIPIQVLLLVYTLAKFLFAYSVDSVLKDKQKTATSFGIAVAMTFSVLCCITAAAMETRRLSLIRSHGLVHMPDGDAPMSTFWLLFQFVLLAGLDSFLEISVAAFYKDQLPQTMKRYVDVFAKAVTGLGFICSVLSVSLVGKMSGSGGKRGWFQHSLNESRLDRYYWVLATLSSVNLLVFIVLAARYKHKNRAGQGKKGSLFELLTCGLWLEDDGNLAKCFCCCGCCCCCCKSLEK